MIRIKQDISVTDAIEKILVENYAAKPINDYQKQVLIQTKNLAWQDTNFDQVLSYTIQDQFSSLPDIDEIRELFEEMPEELREVLEDNEVLDLAKKFSTEK